MTCLFLFVVDCVVVTKDQVAQLDVEVSRLNLGLIEKESELHAKTAHCRQLELKLAKSNQELKKMIDDIGALTKSYQQETCRQEAAILDYAEKLRKVQVRTNEHVNCRFNEFINYSLPFVRWKSNA